MNKFILDTYSDLLILNHGLAAATRFSDATNNMISHDRFSRFLNGAVCGGKELWELSKQSIKSAGGSKKCYLAIDDSIIEKPYTDESSINCWHYSHTKGRCIKGQEILTLLCIFEDCVIPFSYQVIEKSIEYCCLETRKLKRRSSVSKNEIARSLIQKAIDAGVEFDYVLADSWFCCAQTLDFINEQGKKFIFGIKSNRNTYSSLEKRETNAKIKLSQLDLEENDFVPVFLNSLEFQLRVMKKTFTNESGSQGTLYLVSNEADLSAQEIYSIYQKRWEIEVYHKSIKSNLGIARSPTKVRASQLNHIFAALYAFVKLESLKIKTKKNHFQIKREIHIYSLQMASKKLEELREMAG